MSHLDDDTLRRVHLAAITADLARSRSTLLSWVDARIVVMDFMVEPAANPAEPHGVLFSDLRRLNVLPHATELIAWLDMAITLTTGRYRPEAEVFRAISARLRQPRPLASTPPPSSPLVAAEPSRAPAKANLEPLPRTGPDSGGTDAVAHGEPPAQTLETRATREVLLAALMGLLPPQFDVVLFQLAIPPAYLSSTNAPQATRATEILRYLEWANELERLPSIIENLKASDTGPDRGGAAAQQA
jgi:hypothetical protein